METIRLFQIADVLYTLLKKENKISDADIYSIASIFKVTAENELLEAQHKFYRKPKQ